MHACVNKKIKIMLENMYINTWKIFESSFNCKSLMSFFFGFKLLAWIVFLWNMDVSFAKKNAFVQRVFRLICLMLPTDVNHVIVSNNNSRKMFDRSSIHYPAPIIFTHLFMTFSTIHPSSNKIYVSQLREIANKNKKKIENTYNP